MTATFPLVFDGRQAQAVRVSEVGELTCALGHLGLHPPRPTVVVVGGARGLDEAGMARVRQLLITAIVPAIEQHGAVGVDGGTLSGVIRLFGEARSAAHATFPLVGVAAEGTVRLPGGHSRQDTDTDLEPHHTHFVLVPGDQWGAESPWIAHTATIVAGKAPSITVLMNGGEIAYFDVERSIHAGRAVVVAAGSGRTADALADALAGSGDDARASALVGSGLIRSVRVDDVHAFAELLAGALAGSRD